jgi:predicted ATPase/class 3 adenylate cyclase
MPACPSCGQENPDGFKFCGACGGSLEAPAVVACPSCGQENPAGFTFCGACGAALAPEEPASEEERKVVTALFTDIVGSTASAEEMDPEDVRARLSPYYSRLRAELESFGGTVEKFIGDAVVALFGAPVAHEDDPERAVRAALAINKAIGELNEQDDWLDIHVRTAVHTGEALVVVGAKASEGEGMAAGDVMNTAARLQGGAPVDGIAVGESTYRATADIFEYEQGEPVQAKGKTEPIPIWVVTGEKAPPERPTVRTPLVGRSAELAHLTGVWEGVLDRRRPRLVTLLGPPGIGKSRLLLAFCERVEEAGVVHWGRCLSYGEGMTYWPLTEIIKSAAGIRHDDDPGADSVKLGRLLESLPTKDEDELRTIAAALANLVGAPTTPRGTYSAESISQAELHWAIRRLLPLLAQERPMMLIFEDLHWAEPTLVELLQSLTHPEGDAAPFLVLGSGRPEFAESQPGFVANVDGRESLSLQPLGEGEIEELLTELLADTPLDSAHVQRLVRNAGGNPLFLEETVRMVADAKGEGDLENLPVPETVQALIGSRLDSLPGADKRVAQQASVVGNVFWPGAVAHIGDIEGDLQPNLDTLERRDFVHAQRETTVVGEQEYAFKHILIRDVAYERLPKGRRAELHARFVPWLRELGSEDEFVEIEAHHLGQACLHARAVARSPIEAPVLDAARALSRAADRAERREGMREAERFCARALELVGDDYPETALELQLPNARPLAFLARIEQARERLAQVAETAGDLGRLDLRGSALVGLAGLDHRQGQAAEARSRLAEAETLAASSGDRRLQIRTAFALAAVGGDLGGAFEQAIEHLQRGVSIAEEVDDRVLRVEGHLRLAFVLFNAGRLADAQDEVERCLQLAAELGSRRDEARALFLFAYVRFEWGDLDESERRAVEAMDALERTGEPFFQVQNFGLLAQCALERGDPELAEQRLRPALPLALEEGGWLLIAIYRLLAQALVEQGRVDDAAELVEFAGRNVPEDYAYAQALLMLGQATVACGRGARDEAIRCYREALRLLEEARMPLDLCRARVAFARALASFGDDDGARRELEGARRTAVEVGADGFAAKLERELMAMASGAG